MWRRYRWLKSWPLLLAAVAAFLAASKLLADTEARAFVAFALVALGAVSLGAWIALLASHDYSGREEVSDDERSAERGEDHQGRDQ